MSRIAYLDCFSGASGDMFLGALLDLGLPLDGLRGALGSLAIEYGARVGRPRAARRRVGDEVPAAGSRADGCRHRRSPPRSRRGIGIVMTTITVTITIMITRTITVTVTLMVMKRRTTMGRITA